MTKILKILTTLTVVTSAPLTMVACNNNKINNGIDLNSIIKNTNLFTIKTYGARVPTIVEIIDVAKKLNTNWNIDWNKITVDENSITNTGAQLISTDTKVYYGVVNIIFTVNITNNNLNYKDDKSFIGTDSNEKGLSSEIVLFKNWNYYSNNWQNFVQDFIKIIFANDSYLEVSSQYYKSKLSASQLNFNTKQISDKFKDITIGWNPGWW